MDIRIPGIYGVQLYQILKIMDSSIKVLFVSALCCRRINEHIS